MINDDKYVKQKDETKNKTAKSTDNLTNDNMTNDKMTNDN